MTDIHAMCLNIIDAESGEIDAQILFWPSEVAMPGYVETIERKYLDTRWRTERINLLPNPLPTLRQHGPESEAS